MKLRQGQYQSSDRILSLSFFLLCEFAMKKYFLKQVIMIIPTVLIVTFISFLLIRMMPVDAVERYLLTHHLERNAENIALAEEKFGLDEPVITQYVTWLRDLIHLDFGKSYSNGQDVAPLLWNSLVHTLELTLASLVWIVIMTPLLGISASRKPSGIIDKVTRVYCLFGTAIPTFVLGFLLIRLFTINLRIFPTVSDGSIKSLILPSFTLSLSHIAYFVQMLRNEMINNRGETFVLYARSRGISERRIFLTHLFKNSIQPLVNTLGISIGGMIAGSVIVENVFSWPGLGRLITKAILSRDYPLIQGYILIIAFTYILANTFSDFLSALVDPRIRLGKGDIS